MIRINLLPHREEQRTERRRQFWVLAVLAVAFGLVIGLGGHVLNAGYISKQENRNAFLQQKITALDQEIAEIKSLRERIASLLQRKQIIESLQSRRAESVHLLNELAKAMPEGVYVSAATQVGNRVTLKGSAQSHSRVSLLMRALESSPFLMQPELVEAQKVSQDNRDVSAFILHINIVRPEVVEGEGGE